MTPRTLAILAIVTIVVAAGAVLVTVRGSDSGTRKAAAPALFSAITERINDVASISIRKGADEITLEKRGDGETEEGSSSGWVVASKGGYPAKFDQVKTSLMGVVDVDQPSPKTDDPALHARIGVEEPGADNDAALVTLKDAAGAVIASFIVGDSTFIGSTSATYVRPADSPQSWLVEKRLDFPVEPARWMNTEIIRLDRNRVRSVAITHPDGHTLTASRQNKDEQNFAVADIPEGRELTSVSAAVPTANALSFLSFEDVRPAEGREIPADAVVAEYETFDGLTLRIRTWTEPAAESDASAEPATWAALEAVGPSPAAAEESAPDEDADLADSTAEAEGVEEVGPPADLAAEEEAEEAEATDPALVAAEAEDLNERLARWQFKLPGYKADTLRTPLEGLLKPATE